MAVHVFDRDTAVRRAGDGKFEAEIEGHRWWVVRGPNGGFVAAILLRAITEELGDPGRPPRSLSVHYPGAPQPGTLEISVTRERVGRTDRTEKFAVEIFRVVITKTVRRVGQDREGMNQALF